jgi:hypothetical protein
MFLPTFVIGIAQLNPDLILTDLHWKRLQVVAFVIEASSALQIEAPPVPVARENAMPDRPTGQGIAHMGTLVVRSVDPSIDIEERDTPALPDSDGLGFALLNVTHRRYVYPLR